MDSNRFDTLTRQLASGVSRRQVLKGILSFAFGSLLANLGFTSEANAYAGDSPYQDFDQALFLPTIQRVCEEASACGNRKNCGEGCLCVETTEGDIRCGQLPSTCDVLLCESSADCAELGEGYFCDAPNSGCCTNPPASLSRCIAPCCPAEKVCGDACCADGEVCNNGVCSSPANPDCAIGSVTLESMRAALTALEAGETSVNLSPGGCIQVGQTLLNDAVVAKSLTINDKVVSSWSLVNKKWTGQRDSDQDGFFEWRSVTTMGATDEEFTTVETEFSPITEKAIRRTTLTPQDEMIHVVVEEANNAGVLQVVDEYDTPAIQESALTPDQIPGGEGAVANWKQATCEANPCDATKIKERMEEGVNLALQCLGDYGDSGIAIYEAALNILSRRMTIRCAAIPGETQANIGGWANAGGRLTVTVDPTKYCGIDEGARAWLMFHEILHAALQRGHDSRIEQLNSEQRKQLDRVYGCVAFCYENKAKPTRCMCAQCLGTLPCDPICAAFNSDCGATCPCPTRLGQYYDTCTKCLTECPSGLSCFGFSYCDPVGQSSLCPPVLCPA